MQRSIAQITNAGYTVTGSMQDIETIGGGFTVADLLGTLDHQKVPAGIEVSRIDLQKLFVQMTTDTNSKQIYRQNNVRVIQRICYSAEKRNAKTKKNMNAYKRLEVVAYRGVGKKNKEIVTLTGYNADDFEMLAKKSVTSGIHDQKYYRVRPRFYRFFSLELVRVAIKKSILY